MTPAEIQSLTEQAGFEWASLGFRDRMCFATLVDLVAAKAAADEREECAALCDRFAARTTEAQQGPSDTLSNVMLRQVAVLGFGEAAQAIRARSPQ